jgi:hypothetical protein
MRIQRPEAMEMKANKSLMSALLGVALLAMPIAASAHDDWRNRAPAPAYNQVATNNRLWATPTAPLARVRDRNTWRWRDRDGAGWRNLNYSNRNDYRPVARADCPVAAPYNRYPNNYRPNYDQQAYTFAPQSYRGPSGGRLANLVHQRDSAQALYQRALRRGDRVGAKHLHNDIVDLNKRIGGAEQRG